MLIIRNASEVLCLTHPGIRALVSQRFQQLASPDDADFAGYFIIAEAGDTAEVLETETGYPILNDLFNLDIRFPNPAFYPSSDVLENHAHCFEQVWITSDSGFAIMLIIPKTEGIDSTILAMCTEYAIPAS